MEVWWKEESLVYDTKMFQFAIKLFRLKRKIKAWNKEQFRNIHSLNAKLETQIFQLEKSIHNPQVTNQFDQVKKIAKALDDIYLKEEMFWK